MCMYDWVSVHVESALCVRVTIVMYTYVHKYTVAENTGVMRRVMRRVVKWTTNKSFANFGS